MAAGYRYALFEDLAYLSVTGLGSAVPQPVILGSATSITEFEGSGVTLAFSGSGPLYSFCSSHLRAFWRARASMMWGEMISNAQTAVTVIDPVVGSASQVNFASALADDELFIGEIQAGVRWEHELIFVPATAFAQVAFEFQYWDTDVGWAQSQSQATVGATSGIASAVAGPDVELDLLGFNVGAGLVW